SRRSRLSALPGVTPATQPEARATPRTSTATSAISSSGRAITSAAARSCPGTSRVDASNSAAKGTRPLGRVRAIAGRHQSAAEAHARARRNRLVPASSLPVTPTPATHPLPDGGCSVLLPELCLSRRRRAGCRSIARCAPRRRLRALAHARVEEAVHAVLAGQALAPGAGQMAEGVRQRLGYRTGCARQERSHLIGVFARQDRTGRVQQGAA